MALFGTAGIRGDVTDVVTPGLALAVGRAVGIEARRLRGAEVVLARDGRVTGAALAAALEAGLLSSGTSVRRAGAVPTPALAFASEDRLGVMVTASHNPPTDNGIKLFHDGVEFDTDAEHRIEARVDGDEGAFEWNEWSSGTNVDVLEDYRSAVARYALEFGDELDGLQIAVDCGNGMAASAAPQILTALGGDVTALNANVDGHFPARPSKPTPESLAEFCAFVARGPYEVGFGHDGDADRVVVVDGSGGIVHEDTVVAILAERYVEEAPSPAPVVVTTPNASTRIDERVAAVGGRTERVALGQLHEGIARVRKAGDAVAFAAEPWKHVHPRLGGWIDGIASAAVLSRLVADAEDVETLREPVTELPYRKDQVECLDSRKHDAMVRLTGTLPARFPRATVDTDFGVRLDFPDGSWLLVRPSGTEAFIRLYAEGDDVDALMEAAITVVEEATSAG